MNSLSNTYNTSLNNFCIVGINYRKSDMSVRGKFSLPPEQAVSLLKQSLLQHISGCVVLSTCNRTEVYGLLENPHELIGLFCHYTHSERNDFISHGYVYQGMEAIRHLFEVASGLDSQIIGDYEILSQLKHAATISRENGCLNSFMERAVNYALQVSKEIKTKTKLSTGTVSVSYAAIEIIREKVKDTFNKKILLVGTGKFGNHIAKNLQNYLQGCHLYFSNRTDEKAKLLADEYNGTFIPYESLAEECNNADIIITSSLSTSYTILPSFFTIQKPHLLLDLSVPQNVDPSVKDLPGITLLNVDEVSLILDKTISRRKEEIPKAYKIIDDTLSSLESWHRQQANNPSLVTVKSQLHKLNDAYFHSISNEEKIHKTVSSLAIQLRQKNNRGCQCIGALNSYLQTNYETTS